MRDLYLKRNELNKLSQKLRTIKFELKLTKKQVEQLIQKQNEVYKRFKFYDNYLKVGGKIYEQQIHIKNK